MISQVYLNPENENLIIETFDHHLNRKREEEYDMVVLSSGFKPSRGFCRLAKTLALVKNPYGFLTTAFDEPVSASRPGIFVCGGIEAPQDIPETVIQAGAAAAYIAASGIYGKPPAWDTYRQRRSDIFEPARREDTRKSFGIQSAIYPQI
jgi:heterodisulfide reductase subunit A-like polyferredoxin